MIQGNVSLEESKENPTNNLQEILQQSHTKRENSLLKSNLDKTEQEIFAEKNEQFLHAVEKFCYLIIGPLDYLLPYEEWPIVSTLMIFLVIYFMVEFIIIVMNVFSVYSGLSHFMVGVTLMVWGSDNMEMLNLAIAISKGEEEMATIAVLSC